MSFARFNGGGGGTQQSFSRFLQQDNGQDNNPYAPEKIQHQIDNASLRIQDAGFNVADSDKRNAFEKFTNLPQDQNWFFDTLELLGRGGSAVKNIIDKSIINDREDPGTALYRGFAGREKVSGVDLAKKAGIDNGVGQFIAGTALDIGLDPTTYIPGGVIAKGVGAVAKPVAGAAKTAYNAIEEASPALKSFRETRLQPSFESAKDSLGYMFNRDYGIQDTLSGGKSDALKSLDTSTEASRKFMQEESAKTVANAAKAAGGLDTGTDVGRLLEKDLKQFEDIPLTDAQKTQLQEVDNEISNIIPQYKDLNQTVRDLNNYHYQQVLAEAQSPLIKSIREATGGKMLRVDGTEELKDVPAWMKRKDGVPIDEVAQTLGYKYADDLMQELKGTLSNRVKTSDIRNIVKDRVANDAYLQEIINNKQSLKNTIDVLSKSKNEIQPGQKLIDRAAREMPSDPKIQQAAQSLVSSNDTIRQFAKENGIDIPELEGYMTHVWSQEERNLRKQGKPIKVDQGQFNTGNPNKKILNKRELTGSVEDVNDKIGRNFFEPNAYFATGIGQKRLIDYVHAVKFRREVLSNPDFAVKYEKGMDIPKNVEVIDTNNYTFLKKNGDVLDGLPLADKIGGQYVVTKAAKQLLDNYKRMNTDEGTKAFLKAFDGVQSMWKRFTLFSPGYHVRNLAGAMFNNSVGGMSIPDLGKYTTEAFAEVQSAIKGKESTLFNEYRKQGLSSSGLSQVEFARAGQEPEEAIRKTVERMSKQGMDKVKSKVLSPFQTSQELGDAMDQMNRFALYKWAREKKGMPPEQAAMKVKEVQFDYTKLTPFERNVMARVVPFYRWMRNNIPYQIRTFINDPRKYGWVNDARLNAQEAVGIDENNVPDYMKESFSVPVYGDKGKGKMLGLNLPLGDLTKLSSPGKTFVDSFTPLVKTPIELATNFNTFYRKPIEKFQGQQKQFQLGPLDFGIDAKTAYALEQATGQIGRGLSGYLQKPESQDQDTTFRMPSLGISSLLKPFDAEKAASLKQLQQLKALQDYILYIQQQSGEKPRTVNEIRR